MYRIITIEREFGSGAGDIARELANRLGWKLWDHALTEEIAKLAQVDCSAVERREERVDSPFYRLAKVFWRGSYERSLPVTGPEIFDADCLVRMGQQVMERAAAAGDCVIVGRGAPYFLRERPVESLQNGGDDPRSAGRAKTHDDFAVLFHERGTHTA